jgi:hypothetical protein
MRNDIHNFSRTSIPGTLALRLPEATGRVVYYKGLGMPALELLNLRVTGPRGEPIPVQPYQGNIEYNAPSDASGHAVGTFQTITAGTYKRAVHATAPHALVAVGGSIVADAGWQAAAPTILLVLGLIAAAVLVVVTAVRRSSWRRTRVPALPIPAPTPSG